MLVADCESCIVAPRSRLKSISWEATDALAAVRVRYTLNDVAETRVRQSCCKAASMLLEGGCAALCDAYGFVAIQTCRTSRRTSVHSLAATLGKHGLKV